MTTRRQFLHGAAALTLASAFSPISGFSQNKSRTRLILLGTKGGPRVANTGRSNPSTLLLIDNEPYVIDSGYGTTRQLLSVGISAEQVRSIFITHLHSDHTIEYGTLFYSGWAAGSSARVDTYGPEGLEEMTRGFFSMMRADIEVRIEDEGRPDLRTLVNVHEIGKPGTVLQNSILKVTAAQVRHPLIKQAYAYRFDTPDRSVVISGDTAYSPELAELAHGVDVLVHEAMYLPAIESLARRYPEATRLKEHLLDSHTTTEDVGTLAAQANVKTLVLSHFVPGDDPTITDEQWREGAAKHFKGRIIVGKDLMEI